MLGIKAIVRTRALIVPNLPIRSGVRFTVSQAFLDFGPYERISLELTPPGVRGPVAFSGREGSLEVGQPGGNTCCRCHAISDRNSEHGGRQTTEGIFGER